MTRKAAINDIKEIHYMLSVYAKRGILLGRSLSELYDHIRDFIVSLDVEENSVVGICGLHICWENIAEIRSLAVKEGYEGRGIGKDLVSTCIDEALQMDVKKVFVLTYVPEFFKKLGFYTVEKSVLPHKVWTDCIKCIKFPNCDEEAMMLEL